MILIQFTDGDLAELESMDLGGASVRGFVFYRGTFSREEKSDFVQVEYQNRRFALPNGPRIFVFDNEGFMHHFNYYDTRYPLLSQSILMDPIKVEVLREFRAVPAIMIPPSDTESQLMRNQDMNLFKSLFKTEGMIESDPCKSIQRKTFFDYQGRSEAIRNWGDEKGDNPYMLGIL